MKNFTEAKSVLARYVTPRTLKDIYSLDNIKALMEKLGNPQDKLKVIHVAGTSGKTSTCYYIASMLTRAGKKTGLTVSPHVYEINERVQIDMEPLLEVEFCNALSEFIEIVDKTGLKPTYFELMVAFAYWYFEKEKVDYAVVEVGLGGLLDGTNTLTREDKVCVITDIGLDHMEVLGKSLEEIAAQKAGIIQPGNQAFSAVQPPEVLNILRRTALEKLADVAQIPPLQDTDHDLDALPLFQRRNWWLAFTVFDYVVERDGFTMLNPTELRYTMDTYIPARMEVVKIGDKTLVLDGAHNAQKIQLLAEAIKDKFGEQKVATLLAVKDSPDFVARIDLEPLAMLSASFVVTSFSSQQDLPIKSVDPAKVADQLKILGAQDVKVINEPAKAFAELLNQPAEILLITGSFYLMSFIKPLISQADESA